jgi:hypothetical protein
MSVLQSGDKAPQNSWLIRRYRDPQANFGCAA